VSARPENGPATRLTRILDYKTVPSPCKGK
jgi:hypothetical protein